MPFIVHNENNSMNTMRRLQRRKNFKTPDLPKMTVNYGRRKQILSEKQKNGTDVSVLCQENSR